MDSIAPSSKLWWRPRPFIVAGTWFKDGEIPRIALRNDSRSRKWGGILVINDLPGDEMRGICRVGLSLIYHTALREVTQLALYLSEGGLYLRIYSKEPSQCGRALGKTLLVYHEI